MNVVGIIAEYNPFHQGHAYQIEKLREDTHADYVIIAMSGNFVQRGAPALMDKYHRTKMALSCGADLVLELPALCACASAEYFARGGVSLLNSTGVVTHLGFGAESRELGLVQKAAALLTKKPAPFQEVLEQELKSGLSFPLARSKALMACLADEPDIDEETFGQMLSAPNNILAIEYLKAISRCAPRLAPVLVPRQGRGYHDTGLSHGFCSASGIRSRLHGSVFDREACRNVISDPLKLLLKPAMPDASYEILAGYPHPFLFEDDFSALVHYKLLTEPLESLADYADSSLDLASRMYHARHDFRSWAQFCELLKSRNTTYTRISRLLLHLVLNIRKEDQAKLAAPSPVPYLRVLGFRKAASPLLSSIKQHAKVPLVTSCSAAMKQLPAEACRFLLADTTASDIYNLALTAKGAGSLLSDYRHPLMIL